jgi:hypothetical protein
MIDATEAFDVELGRLQGEVAKIEPLPPTVSERYAAAEAELLEAERIFRTYGLSPSAPLPGATAHLQRLAAIGAAMIANPAAILKATHQRIAAVGAGMSAVDKQRRLEELRRQILRAAARRELALREVERAGEFLPRPTVHPELVVATHGYLVQMANGVGPS